MTTHPTPSAQGGAEQHLDYLRGTIVDRLKKQAEVTDNFVTNQLLIEAIVHLERDALSTLTPEAVREMCAEVAANGYVRYEKYDSAYPDAAYDHSAKDGKRWTRPMSPDEIENKIRALDLSQPSAGNEPWVSEEFAKAHGIEEEPSAPSVAGGAGLPELMRSIAGDLIVACSPEYPFADVYVKKNTALRDTLRDAANEIESLRTAAEAMQARIAELERERDEAKDQLKLAFDKDLVLKACVEQEADLAAAIPDAERYRWLCDQGFCYAPSLWNSGIGFHANVSKREPATKENLDAAIDNAIGAEGKV